MGKARLSIDNSRSQVHAETPETDELLIELAEWCGDNPEAGADYVGERLILALRRMEVSRNVNRHLYLARDREAKEMGDWIANARRVYGHPSPLDLRKQYAGEKEYLSWFSLAPEQEGNKAKVRTNDSLLTYSFMVPIKDLK